MGEIVPNVFLEDLGVGDSFSAERLSPSKYNSFKQKVRRQSALIGVKCSIRTVAGETYCWRIA
jgi:hypothetical protein